MLYYCRFDRLERYLSIGDHPWIIYPTKIEWWIMVTWRKLWSGGFRYAFYICIKHWREISYIRPKSQFSLKIPNFDPNLDKDLIFELYGIAYTNFWSRIDFYRKSWKSYFWSKNVIFGAKIVFFTEISDNYLLTSSHIESS